MPLCVSPLHPRLTLATHKQIRLALCVPVSDQFLVSFETSRFAANKLTVMDSFIIWRMRWLSLLFFVFFFLDVFCFLSELFISDDIENDFIDALVGCEFDVAVRTFLIGLEPHFDAGCAK